MSQYFFYLTDFYCFKMSTLKSHEIILINDFLIKWKLIHKCQTPLSKGLLYNFKFFLIIQAQFTLKRIIDR